jgi:transcriptional regulator with XRE-family HTH domain
METQEPLVNYDIPVNEGLDPEVEPELDPIIIALKKERLVKGWTQWDVAKRMGYSAPSYVSQLESGQLDATLSTLRAWHAALGLELLTRAPQSGRGRPRTNFR